MTVVLYPLVFALALVVASAGCALIASSQPAHWRRVAGPRPLTPRVVRRLRSLGALLIAAALGVTMLGDAVAFALVIWCILLSIAASGVAMTLAWWPAGLRGLVLPFIDREPLER